MNKNKSAETTTTHHQQDARQSDRQTDGQVKLGQKENDSLIFFHSSLSSPSQYYLDNITSHKIILASIHLLLLLRLHYRCRRCPTIYNSNILHCAGCSPCYLLYLGVGLLFVSLSISAHWSTTFSSLLDQIINPPRVAPSYSLIRTLPRLVTWLLLVRVTSHSRATHFVA